MDTYLAGFGNYARTNAPRPMSQEDEDAYYDRAERAWSTLAWLGATGLPFSPLNPRKASPEQNNSVRSFFGKEAGQWH